MILEIGKKKCELNFGIGFIRSLDEKYFQEGSSGAKFGCGLETKVPMLLTGDVVALAEFIQLGTAGMGIKQPSLEEIDDYIDSAPDIEKVFDEVVEELKKSNACKLKMRDLEESLKRAERQLNG